MKAVKPRIDEGPLRVRSFVIDSEGVLVEPSTVEPGVEIWEELPPGAIGVSVLSTDEGGGYKYFYGAPVTRSLPQAQEKALVELLKGYGQAVDMTQEQYELNNRVYNDYVF